jgi:DNA-directed RNA polymerase specialized sigma24 family protein
MSDPKTEALSGCFPTTQWTQIIRVIQAGDEASAWGALADFCEGYRPAIRDFFRRRGCGPEEAEDLTQSFFETRVMKPWCQRNGFLHAARQGPETRFRCFLCQVLWRFLQDEWKRRKTLKAGGGSSFIPLEEGELAAGGAEDDAYTKFGREFDRVFALQILHRAAGSSRHSKYLVAHLRGEISQEEAAGHLGLSANAFKQAHYRFRRRLEADLREEVLKLVGPDEKEIRGELKYLMSLFDEPGGEASARRERSEA